MGELKIDYVAYQCARSQQQEVVPFGEQPTHGQIHVAQDRVSRCEKKNGKCPSTCTLKAILFEAPQKS